MEKEQETVYPRSRSLGYDLPDRQNRIMIVEDDRDMADVYRRVLEREAFPTPVFAETVAEALSKFGDLKSKDNGLELLITDNRLPDGLGIDLSKRLIARNPKLKIILASGDLSVTDSDAREVGIAKVLRKPFSVSALVSTVLQLAATIKQEQEV